MRLFRLTCCLALGVSALSTASAQTKKRAVRSNLFALTAVSMNTNRVLCPVNNVGQNCYFAGDAVIEGGYWPPNTPDSYIFDAGPQIVGIIPPTAGFAWAGDTVGSFFYDARGDQADGSPVTLVYNSRDSSDLNAWPHGGFVRDPAIYSATLLGRPSIGDQDTWTRYWDGNPYRLGGGRSHPMGIAVDQRAVEWNGPEGNEDMLYFIFTFTNVTARDPAAYAGIDAASRADFIRLGSVYDSTGFANFGVSIPPGGYTIDSVFLSASMDPDVGSDHVTQNYATANLPLGTAFAYEAPFQEKSWAFPTNVFGLSGLTAAPGLIGIRWVRYPTDTAGNPVPVRVFSNALNDVTGYPDAVGIRQLYRYLSGTSSPTYGDQPCSVQGQQISLHYCFLATTSSDTRYFFSVGPFQLKPGQQQTAIVAYVWAAPRDTVIPYIGGDLKPGFPYTADSVAADTTKVRLIDRIAGWVTQFDSNADGKIESNEVKTFPGSLFWKAQVAQAFADAKFLSPQTPLPPSFFLIPADRRVTVVWQRSPSETTGNPYFSVASDPSTALYDPNFRKYDVEGYRIYRGLSPTTLHVVAQFDYTGTEMDDYLGDFDYTSQCAPEYGVVSGCPAPFTGTPTSVHAQHPLVGDVVQIPAGGRFVTKNGDVAVTTADTAVTGGGSGFLPLVDNGVTFSWIDLGVQNSFRYYYSVTAFTVNSVRSGPTSLESPRITKTVVPRTGTAFTGGTIGTPQLLAANGTVLSGTAPTLNPSTGEFSGPAAPTNALSLSLVSFLPQLLDTGSLIVRVDSVHPGVFGVDYGSEVPATYYVTSTNARGNSSTAVIPIPVDNTQVDVTAPPVQVIGAPVLPSKAVVFGADTAFALVAQVAVASSGAWLLTSPGRGAVNSYPNTSLTGDRWWSGTSNENTPGPTDSLCVPAIGTCTRTLSQLAHTGGTLPGVTFIAPIQGYSTVRSVPARDLETVTAGVYRAADFTVFWGSGGTIDSVIDVTHGVPVPFDSRIGPTWGILDSTSFVGFTATDTPDSNTSVLTWSDVMCVSPANTFVSAVFGSGCANQAAPLVRTAHLSTIATATGNYGSVPASQGPGFFLYLAGKFWMLAMSSLPASGTVWHARYFTGHITGTEPNLTYTPATFAPAAVPGLRIRLSYSGSSIDLTHTTDSALARVHTVPDPFYVTNALGTTVDSQRIEFVHLPPEAIIRIYSVSGRLVALLTHDDPSGGGQEDWNVKTRDGNTVASGVYFYVVETADRRSKVGRFTVVTLHP